MELGTLYKRVIGLDVHQAQITACALIATYEASQIDLKKIYILCSSVAIIELRDKPFCHPY